ncbi:alpha-L-glutamate ligase-like protein [Candidatus Woesebacteria bacterium]|nr:alpha-L-glutamate ligase-like protein [Candidatus Woesebacteria bacterium]MCD8527662.1 alpha-L-glutamate ligase-like protein [Candidatus Woesebacteria bacterium]MCD8546368.1 alpha-L-glutamate ligase-like protein [Candidatus Woesebacteria bacterium]
MVKPGDILGLNARVQRYTSLNSRKAKRLGFSKLRAKAFLSKHNIGVPQLYAQITSQEELREFNWHSIEGHFAVKPASGSAGKGIIVISHKVGHDRWVDVSGKEYSSDDLTLHVSDILDGQYSTWGNRHKALVEERIPIHPDLEDYVMQGTPDIRVILYRKIPIMAMARIPTKASNGRANLDQGAIGLGIDMGTGKSTFAVSGKKKSITYFPHNNASVRGIQIPYWLEVLKTAVRTANASGMVYLGVDIFLHPEKGPMIAEVNAYPGLSIQLANHAGLRQRLERVEGVQARSVLHAVKIGQSLFAENYPGIGNEVDRPIINIRETIKLLDDKRTYHDVKALINTQRLQSAIAESLATELKLNERRDLLYNQSDEDEGKVPVVPVSIKIRDRIIPTSMIVSKRLNHKKHNIELGRNDLKGFLILGE